jgi:hypothetical protein
MTTRDQLLYEINTALEPLLEAVLDFLLFAKARRQQQAVAPAIAEAASQPSTPIWEAFESFANSLVGRCVTAAPNSTLQLDLEERYGDIHFNIHQGSRTTHQHSKGDNVGGDLVQGAKHGQP